MPSFESKWCRACSLLAFIYTGCVLVAPIDDIEETSWGASPLNSDIPRAGDSAPPQQNFDGGARMDASLSTVDSRTDAGQRNDAGVGPDAATSTATASGRVIVDWTIEGEKDARVCVAHDATRIAVVFYVRNTSITFDTTPCSDFQTAFKLSPDDYAGMAMLIDPERNALTTAVDFGEFSLTAGEDEAIFINFPPSSFY